MKRLALLTLALILVSGCGNDAKKNQLGTSQGAPNKLDQAQVDQMQQSLGQADLHTGNIIDPATKFNIGEFWFDSKNKTVTVILEYGKFASIPGSQGPAYPYSKFFLVNAAGRSDKSFVFDERASFGAPVTTITDIVNQYSIISEDSYGSAKYNFSLD